jgi:hypothetical protein
MLCFGTILRFVCFGKTEILYAVSIVTTLCETSERQREGQLAGQNKRRRARGL